MARNVNPNDIFLGNTQATGRAFLSRVFNVISLDYDRLVIPCVGKFAMAEAAKTSLNWKMEKLETSDISLFSTLVGFHITEQDIGNLKVMLHEGDKEPVQLFDAPESLYQQKLGIMERTAKTYHMKLYVEDLIARKDDHKEKLLKGLDTLKDKLSGLSYEARDLTEHFESAIDDPKAVIWLAPPLLTGDYAKMFDDGGRLSWDAPDVPEFNPKTGLQNLLDMEDGSPALVLRHRREGGEYVRDNELDNAVFAEAKSADVKEFTLCNRPDELKEKLGLTVVPRKILQTKPYKAPMLPLDYEITENSVVVWDEVKSDVAMYYRDLFAHRMGLSNTESHHILLVDGYVVGITGLHMYRFRQGQLTYGKRYIEESYGMVVHSDRHLRLNRLLLMLICTQEFIRSAIGPDSLYEPEGVATTCLSRYPEHKTSRGIMKLKNRERQTGGLMAGTWFKLRYASDTTPYSYSEVIKTWLKKYGQIAKTISKDNTKNQQKSSQNSKTMSLSGKST